MLRQRLQGVFEDGLALAAAQAELALGGLEGGAANADGLEHGGETGPGGLERGCDPATGGQGGIARLDPGGGAGPRAGQGVPPLGKRRALHGQFGIAGQAQAGGDLGRGQPGTPGGILAPRQPGDGAVAQIDPHRQGCAVGQGAGPGRVDPAGGPASRTRAVRPGGPAGLKAAARAHREARVTGQGGELGLVQPQDHPGAAIGQDTQDIDPGGGGLDPAALVEQQAAGAVGAQAHRGRTTGASPSRVRVKSSSLSSRASRAGRSRASSAQRQAPATVARLTP